jgi:hypothetical protein
MVDTIQGAYFQTLSLQLALRAGEPFHLAKALAMEAAHESIGGSRSRERTARLLALAEGVARQTGSPHAAALVALAEGIAAALAGDWRQAVERCDQAEKILRESCAGVTWEMGTAYRFALWPLMLRGEVQEIARRLPVRLKEALERDDLYTVTNLSLVVRTFVHLAHDEPERARDELERVMDEWSPHGYHVQHMNRLYDEAQIDLYTGSALSAWQRVAAGWAPVRRAHMLRVQQVYVLLLDLRGRSALAAAAMPGDPRPFLKAAFRDARLLRRERVPWAVALAELLDAGVAGRQGEEQRAAERYGQAAALLEAADMHLYAAAARRRQGALVGGPAGRDLTATADAWMEGQGIRNSQRMTALLAPGLDRKE